MHSIINLHNIIDNDIAMIFIVSYIHRIPNTDIVENENFILGFIKRNNRHFSERFLNILLIQMSTLGYRRDQRYLYISGKHFDLKKYD